MLTRKGEHSELSGEFAMQFRKKFSDERDPPLRLAARPRCCRRLCGQPLLRELGERNVAAELARLEQLCARLSQVEGHVGKRVLGILRWSIRVRQVSTRTRGVTSVQCTHVRFCEELVECIGAPLFVHPARREQLTRNLERPLVLLAFGGE